MKKYISLLLIALMFCAVVSVGCGGSSDSPDTEQTESLNENTGGEDTGDYDLNEESRGTSGTPPTDLSMIRADYIAKDGETLTGKLGANVKVSIADGATVTIRDVTIDGEDHRVYNWAGLTCVGDATINLEGTNSVKGFYWDYPGIYVPKDKTLTIKGKGSLTASSNDFGAGIGAGWEKHCGNIVIEGGTIIAEGGYYAAGIGGGYHSDCGSITISGADVNAKKGKYATYRIGAGYKANCGKVIINGVEKGSIE